MINRKGIEPVIATVILIAIAVAVAIAVAFWAAGLTGAFTRFEKLEVTNSFVTRNTNDYTITVSYRNAGSTDITISNIFIHEKPLNSFWSTAKVNGSSFLGVFVKVGVSGQIIAEFPDDSGGARAFVPGQTVEVKLQTESGVYYVGTFIMP